MVTRMAWSALTALALFPAALLAQQRRLVGSVRVDGTAEPIPGAIVTLFGSAAVPLASGSGRPASSLPHLMTNGDGQFVARGLRKGTLFVTVTKGGYLDATKARTMLGWTPRFTLDAGLRATVDWYTEYFRG